METQSFTSQGVVEDTRRGLLDERKWLSSLYFYDERGSDLFERICRTPEYYLTRTEGALLEAHADEILEAAADGVRDGMVLAELGSGSSAKTRVLLGPLVARQPAAVYLPVDVSADFLHDVAHRLETEFAGLRVHPVAAEYGEGIRRIGGHPAKRRLVLFLGSSIGNFEPDEQVDLLGSLRHHLKPGDACLLGVDLVKDPAVLEAAYNDREGVTAAFNLNILANLNTQLDGDADPDGFDHVAFWNPEASRIEMHLRSRRSQTLRFRRAGLEVPLAAGETIHTENSYKFTPARIEAMAEEAGFACERRWSDADGRFALVLLRVPKG